MNSIWMESAALPRFGPLRRDVHTDVLIIGGGMAGLLCAYLLQQAGVDTVVVEADRICSGITKNTTAKITSQHGLIYHKLRQMYELDTAQWYLQANEAALERYRQLCRRIDCDFQQADAFVYSTADGALLQREMSTLHKLGFPARLEQTPPLPVATVGAVCFPNQAQFHPLKFTAAIAAELPIYEQTKVVALKPGCAVTQRGTVHANRIIVATHFPFLNRRGGYFLKLYQHRSYVLALRGAPLPPGMYVDQAQTGLSFRSFGDLLLLGGGGHRTGKQGEGWRELEAFVCKHYPNAREVARWATQDCMTLDGMPYIGQYSRHTPDLYVATGFNKWGMSSAMVAAIVLSDLVQGRQNRYAPVFSPSRSMLHRQLAVNAAESTLGLLKPTAPRCPHMGCALQYNTQEHTWDCPCHGSRFTEEGELIDNPAMHDKKR